MKKGDIVLLPFPFTDLSGQKNRPTVILIDNDSDITVAFISTRIHWKAETDILLQPTAGNGLKKESLIRLSKIATLDKDLILGRLGEISPFDMNTMDKNLRALLNL
jgi:mRNA interferase MazF